MSLTLSHATPPKGGPPNRFKAELESKALNAFQEFSTLSALVGLESRMIIKPFFEAAGVAL